MNSKICKSRVCKCKGLELQGKETPIFNLGEVSVGMLIRVTAQRYLNGGEKIVFGELGSHQSEVE